MEQNKQHEILRILSEENPGTYQVLFGLYQENEISTMKYLEHRKITGSKLWIAYKFSNRDLKTLIQNVSF